MVDLSIISVNWKSVDYLRKCLTTIHANTKGLNSEVIIVDNDPAEVGVHALREEFPDAEVVRAQSNLGFGMANNLGFEHSCGRNLLFLNPDTEIIGPAIQTMLSRLESLPGAGIVGCRLLNSDGTVQTSCIRCFPTILNQILDIEYLRLRWPHFKLWSIDPLFFPRQEPMKVDGVSGACLMIKREVFKKVGGFSPEYFMYAEDVDLCYKVRQKGFEVYYLGEVTVIHHGGASSKRIRVNHREVILQRNATLKFFQKTRGSLYASTYRVATATAAFCRLNIIILLLPFKNTALGRTISESAFAKWAAVLRWAMGFESQENPEA